MTSLIFRIKKHKKTIFYIVAAYIFIFLVRQYSNKFIMVDLGSIFRPFEIISTFLSLFILKQISDIKEDYYKKATSKKHLENKWIRENNQFYGLYVKKEICLNKITEECEDYCDMRRMAEELKNIKPFLEMFKGKISERLYEDKDTKKYQKYFESFENILQLFSNEGSTILKKNVEKQYYDDTIELINDSITCIKTSFETDSRILNDYEIEMSKKAQKKEERVTKEVNTLNDEDL